MVMLIEKRITGASNGAPFCFCLSSETEKKIKTGKQAGFDGIYSFKYLDWYDFSEVEKNQLEKIVCEDTYFFEVSEEK